MEHGGSKLADVTYDPKTQFVEVCSSFFVGSEQSLGHMYGNIPIL